MPSVIKRSLLCSVLFTVATLASAQDTIVQARVVAQALPSRTVQSAPLQYISHEDIEARGLRDLYEAVKGFAGVNIRDYGGIGGIKTVSIRSLGTEHTAVSYDGATMSNVQSGQVDIGRFSLDNVETVSLSIGQSDDLFRAANLFASAGVLEIRSLKPVFDDDRRFRATAQVRAASFKTLNPSLILEQKFGERWSASVNADWLGSDGTYPFTIENGSLTDTLLRKNSDVKRLRCEANVYGNVGTNGELSFKANYLESERGLPGSVVLYNPTANERLWDRNAFAHIRYVTKLSQFWKFQANAKYSYAWTRYLDTGERYPGGKQDDRYTQNEWYASATALFRPTDHWTFSAAQDVIVNTLSSTIPECPFPTRLTSMSVVAGQYRGERLTVTADLLATLTSEKVQAGQAAPNRSHLSPSVGFSYKIFKNNSLRLRGSIKDSYRLPSFNDLYYARVGNTRLAPEKALQCNLGLALNAVGNNSFRIDASVDGFYYYVRDKIVAIPTLFIWKMMNIGKVATAGLDASVEASFPMTGLSSLSASVSYTFQYAVDVTDPEGPTYRHQIPYTPRNSGSATVTWINRFINVSYWLTAVGSRFSKLENVERNFVEGFLEHSFSLSHDFDFKTCSLKLSGEVINLTDKNYAYIQYYPMPGRNYRLTLKFRY